MQITEKMIEAAKQAYEQHTPEDYRYSADALSAAITAALSLQEQGELSPFMYGIMCPDGTAYLDEICVDSNDSQTLVDVIEDQGLEGHKVVPLYTRPLPQEPVGVRPREVVGAFSADQRRQVQRIVQANLDAGTFVLTPEMRIAITPPQPDTFREEVRKVLEQIAALPDQMHEGQRYFLQLLVCPESDDREKSATDFGPIIRAARDLLARIGEER